MNSRVGCLSPSVMAGPEEWSPPFRFGEEETETGLYARQAEMRNGGPYRVRHFFCMRGWKKFPDVGYSSGIEWCIVPNLRGGDSLPWRDAGRTSRLHRGQPRAGQLLQAAQEPRPSGAKARVQVGAFCKRPFPPAFGKCL